MVNSHLVCNLVYHLDQAKGFCKTELRGIIQPKICFGRLKIYLENINQWVFNFHDGGPYHIETSPLIGSPNQWTGFYMIGTFVMKYLIV